MSFKTDSKTQKIEQYRRDGVIDRGEVALVAIGAGRFGLYASEYPVPTILSSVFPIGPQVVTIDIERNEVVGNGFAPSFHIERAGGRIPRTAFLDERFSGVSAVVWSRASIGNMSRAERPLSLVHNPTAAIAMTERWGVWDREYVTLREGEQWMATDILAEAQDSVD